jgi:choline kinase
MEAMVTVSRSSPLRAVMLAAGTGGRLGARTSALPKPLVPLGGRPLAAYTIEALAAVGVRELVVVVGYRAGQVREALGDGAGFGIALRYVDNPRYRAGASLSLRAARAAVEAADGDGFLLVMSDHILGQPLLERLLAAANGVSAVGADFLRAASVAPEYVDEATKLEVDDRGYVTAIGKRLDRWSALDTGAFWCTAEVWEALGEAPVDCELSGVFSLLAGRGRLRAADVSGAFWYDVDTDADLRAAGELLPR